MLNRAELATFLRTRRGRLRPADVGLPSAGRRRTPGLRRQEVAQLAGMSVDYYIRLEQGRGPQPSRQVLSALARALLLTADQRDYFTRVRHRGGVHTPAGADRARLARSPAMARRTFRYSTPRHDRTPPGLPCRQVRARPTAARRP